MIVGGQRVSRLALIGDPFIGAPGLVRAAAATAAKGGFLRGLGGLAKKAFGFAGGLIGVAPVMGRVPLPARAFPGVGPFKRVGKAIAVSGAGALAAEAVIRGGRRLLMPGERGRGRRMNACNLKALRRSMRRVQSFARIAARTIRFTKRVKMKRRGRRRGA